MNDITGGADEAPKRRKKPELEPASATELADMKSLLTREACECEDCVGLMRVLLAYEAVTGPLPITKPKKKIDLTRFESNEAEAREKETAATPTLE